MPLPAFDIFSLVLDAEPEARQAALEMACDGDDALRREVESLLRAHETADASFLAKADLGVASALEAARIDRTGEIIGPWRLVREIGAGGMGSVWLAERADGEFQQRVAIKLIRAGMASEDVLHRFRRERQLLARLEHPNVARLIDGGTAGDGTPFLVMEHVVGERIDAYCDRRQLSIEQRITLFMQACAAVQYAHRNLVIHRDLKPSNILVTPDGVPKLLDFGIARLITPDHFYEKTTSSERRLTPAYASPEQVRADPVTTVTDVYSLGVILYELLTGRRPYDLATLTPSEAEQVICDAPPQRPSLAVARLCEPNARSESGPTNAAVVRLFESSARSESGPTGPTNVRSEGETTTQAIARDRGTDATTLRRRLAGDLDTILLMALRKEPERRYPSVEALAEDLRRWLQGLPVSARPDTLTYRTGRFIRRNRTGVSAAAGVALALVGATVVSITMSVKAREAEAIAHVEASAASTVSSFLRDTLSSIDPAVAQGRDTTLLREMLDDTAARLEHQADDPPRVLAELHDTVGRAYHAIGEYAKAEHHLGRAVGFRRDDPHEPRLLADALGALGATLKQRAEYQRSLAALNEALMLRYASLPDDDPAIGVAMTQLGSTRFAAGDYDGGERDLRAAIAQLRSAKAPEPRLLAAALLDLGDLLTDQRRIDESAILLREAQAILRAAHGELHPAIADVEIALGWCARRGGDFLQAVEHYRSALAIHEQLLDENHPTISFNLSGLAAALEDLEQYDEAEALYLRAMSIARAALGQSHTELGTIHNNLGGLYRKMNRLDEAVKHLRAAIDIYSAARGESDIWTSFPWINLARAYSMQGNHAAALDAVDRSLAIRRLHFAPPHRELALARAQRGRVLLDLERFDEAEAELTSAMASLRAELPNDHAGVQFAAESLVKLYEALNRPAEAEPYQRLLAEGSQSSSNQ